MNYKRNLNFEFGINYAEAGRLASGRLTSGRLASELKIKIILFINILAA
jgi:hypothetical protein